MRFSELAQFLDRLEKVSSRNEMTKILAELFAKASSEEIDKIVYLSLGSLAPRYENVVFNLAERLMVQVLAKAYRKDAAEIKKLYKIKGDLGDTAFDLAGKKTSNQSVTQVHQELLVIAQDEGEKSQERKVEKTAALLASLDPISARYVARIPVGKLRLGFSDQTILDALSWLAKGDKSVKEDLKRAYQVVPDVGRLAQVVKKHGVKQASAKVTPVVGIPVLPMLAQRLKSPAEMITKMGEVGVEPKFDGLRIQIHFQRGKPTKAFTRNLNENSWMFPELAKVGAAIKAREAILDTEAVGVDAKRSALANFQTTMTRRRKHEITKTAASVPIRFMVFDILLKDGRSLMGETYKARREIMKKTIPSSRLLVVDEYLITKDPGQIADYSQEQIKKGLEGVLVKKAESRYVPGRTGWRWVKMKEAEGKQTKLADTVDGAVMGYTRGRGKRAEFGVGQFLVGIRDGQKIKTLTKIGTGLTDEQFRQLKKRLTKIQVKEKPGEYEVNKNLEPDFWVKPALVVEIAADEITKSPIHTAGVALRFPRLLRFRDDKSASQATTLSEVKKLLALQKN